MVHYICTGTCQGVSENPGVCQAEDCPKHGQALEQCDCTDDRHYGRQEASQEDEPEKAENEE